MTLYLRRLGLKGFVSRLPDSNRSIVTSYDPRVAFFCSKLYLRLLRLGLVQPEATSLERLARKPCGGGNYARSTAVSRRLGLGVGRRLALWPD